MIWKTNLLFSQRSKGGHFLNQAGLWSHLLKVSPFLPSCPTWRVKSPGQELFDGKEHIPTQACSSKVCVGFFVLFCFSLKAKEKTPRIQVMGLTETRSCQAGRHPPGTVWPHASAPPHTRHSFPVCTLADLVDLLLLLLCNWQLAWGFGLPQRRLGPDCTLATTSVSLIKKLNYWYYLILVNLNAHSHEWLLMTLLNSTERGKTVTVIKSPGLHLTHCCPVFLYLSTLTCKVERIIVPTSENSFEDNHE